VAVLALLGMRPLWADELLQLTGASGGTWSAVIHWAQVLPGGAPLPLLLQKLAVMSLGWSNWAMRLPAALFGIGAAVVFARIARGNRTALAMFLAMPILVRYAMEGRMYSQALFFVLLAWDARSKGVRIVACVAAVYSSPFAIFPLLAIQPLNALVAGAAFLPWWLMQRGCQAAQGSLSAYQFGWAQLSPPLALREFTGGGYWCGVPFLLLVIMGWRGRPERASAMMGASLVGPVLADAIAGYFFATRQWLFGLPAMILTAASASHRAVIVLLCVFFAGALGKDIRQTFFAAEDWGAAAKAIRAELAGGGCLVVAPAEQIAYYSFYEPELTARVCAGEHTGPVVVAASPYTDSADERRQLEGVAVGRKRVVGTMRITTGSYSR